MNNSNVDLDFPLASLEIVLRPFSEHDITQEYLSWLNDAEVMRYSNQRFKTHTQKTCQDYLESFDNTPNQFLSVDLVDTIDHGNGEQMIGTITLYFAPQHGTVDIGILIGDKKHWGRGYGLKVWRLLIDHLFSLEKVRKISAGTLACNRQMISVLEKSGMQLEGRRIDHEVIDGQPVDILYYGRFREA